MDIRFESWVRYVATVMKNKNSIEFTELCGIKDHTLYTYDIHRISDTANDTFLWNLNVRLSDTSFSREIVPGATALCTIRDLMNSVSVYLNRTPDEIILSVSPRFFIIGN